MKMDFITIISTVGVICSLLGDLFIMHKKKNGYLLWIVGNLIMGYNFIFLQLNVPMVVLQAVYIILNSIGFVKWLKEEPRKDIKVIAYDLDETLIGSGYYDKWWIIQNVCMVKEEEWKQMYNRDWDVLLDELLKNTEYGNNIEKRKKDLFKFYEQDFKTVLSGKDYENRFVVNEDLLKEIKENGKNNIIITSRNKSQAKNIINYLGISDNVRELYYSEKEGDKFRNIEMANNKYTVIKAYDDQIKVIDQYKKYGIDAIYVKGRYNDEQIGAKTVQFAEKKLEKEIKNV